MPDLVPVRRGSALARRESSRPQSRPQSQSQLDRSHGPFADFDALWDRMVSRFFNAPLWSAPIWADWTQDWAPPVDIEETDDAWIFEVELPGARREDVQVEVSESELAISGQIQERERVGVVRHRARRMGNFQYRTTLPAGVDADQVEARFENGLLTVRVPRPEQAKARRIKIN